MHRLCRVPKGTLACLGDVASQPMNWLATLIPSLRDFTRCEAALHGTTCPYLVPTAPYTAQQRPYTPRRGFTRCASTLTRHNVPLSRPYGTFTPSFPFTFSTARKRLSTARKRFSTSAEGALSTARKRLSARPAGALSFSISLRKRQSRARSAAEKELLNPSPLCP